jgi:hypothetical protein
MSKPVKFLFVILFTTITLYGHKAKAQLFAPSRKWAAPTQYIASDKQDSVFVYFNVASANLRAQFSDSSASTYTWYKYNENLPVSSRFQIIVGSIDSTLTVINRGGYKVEVKRDVDNSIETYVAWVMIDDVVVNDLKLLSNKCESLELILNTTPDFYEISSLFSYNDLSLPAHQEKSVLGVGGYFTNHIFESSNPQVLVLPKVLSLPFIYIDFENSLNGKTYGPLHDAAYKLTITSPFGRGVVIVETDIIAAIATKVEMEMSFFVNNEWKSQTLGATEMPSGEALLEIELQSTALNADAIFWNIINDPTQFARTGDSIIWSQEAVFSSEKFYPSKRLMIPGFYTVEHIASKNTNGLQCRDTIIQEIEVEMSMLKPDGIPNVFTPNGDGENDVFIIKGLDPNDPSNNSVDEYVMSIRNFSITILSRWGKQVYRYSGDPKKWDGWNGKIDGTKGDVAEGVYFYVIDAVGWDGKKYKNKNYRGFVHLYR